MPCCSASACWRPSPPRSTSTPTASAWGTIGYALAPADATDAVTLLKFADAAMYLGKESGKGCIRRGGAAVLREASSPEAGLAWPQPPEGQPTA